MPDFSLVMLAAGSSSRFHLLAKKQWLRTGDTPLWQFATENIAKTVKPKKIIVVCAKDELSYMQHFNSEYTFVQGGNTRSESLKNALEHVQTETVLVSDVARTYIPKEMVLRILEAYDEENAQCVVPYLPVNDTIVYEEETINRDFVKRVQTPQLSNTSILKKALQKDGDFTDESSAIHAMGAKRTFVLGDEKADKLTFEKDRLIIEHLQGPSKETFTGLGFDVHAFEDNKIMWLGGVQIDSKKGFKAHSDGDVALHALIDALLGAAGAGDIGELFPDTDEAYKDADSKELLKKVVLFLKQTGFEIINCDITIMAQAPKLSSYKTKMRQIIADILDIAPIRVNIKATTTEKLSFVGREEGVAVLANTALKYYDWKAK